MKSIYEDNLVDFLCNGLSEIGFVEEKRYHPATIQHLFRKFIKNDILLFVWQREVYIHRQNNTEKHVIPFENTDQALTIIETCKDAENCDNLLMRIEKMKIKTILENMDS